MNSKAKDGKHEGRSWKHGIAGATAGLTNVLVLHPLDVVKTRLQVQDGAGSLPLYNGTLDAINKIIRSDGIKGLYAGMFPSLLGSATAWGVYFLSYNNAKERYKIVGTRKKDSGPLIHLVSAAEAGILVCLLTNPIWVIKTRLQLQSRNNDSFRTPLRVPKNRATVKNYRLPSNELPKNIVQPSHPQPHYYKGFTDCFYRICREEGLQGLYRGLLPSIFLVAHGAIQFTAYEELKTASHKLRTYVRPFSSDTMMDGQDLTAFEISACGALSKCIASAVTYPSQVVRSRLQQRMEIRAIKYSGIRDVVKKTFWREGVQGFYKGIVPNILRVMPQSALTFLVYETVLKFIDSTE